MATSEYIPRPIESLSEGDYHARLAHTPGLAVVLFTNAPCGACRAWKRLLPQALSAIPTHFYEVDVAIATGIARYFGIFHLPTIYLYRYGHFHAELQAEARTDAILMAVHSLLAAPAQAEP